MINSINFSSNSYLKILQHVKEFSDKEDLTVFAIADTGSHAWGYADENSDHDMKVLFSHNKEKYKNFHMPTETFTHKPDAMHDYQYWDIRKIFQLLRKGNAQLYEVFFSEKQYYESFLYNTLKSLLEDIFKHQTKQIAYHYYGLATKTYRQRIANTGEPTSKKYLYVLRPLMHVEFILMTQQLPSLNFDNVMKESIELPDHVRSATLEILDLKKSGRLEMSAQKYPELDEYIEDRLDVYNKRLKEYSPDKQIDQKELFDRIDILYKKLIFS